MYPERISPSIAGSERIGAKNLQEPFSAVLYSSAHDVMLPSKRGGEALFAVTRSEGDFWKGPEAREWGYWDEQIQRVLAWLPLGSEPGG